MNEFELKSLFARVARKPLDVPDADSVLELSRLPHAEDAASALRADLVRLSRELEPVSEQLSADIAAALGQTSVAAHRRAAPRRAAPARRGWRIAAAAMAACLVVAVAIVATHRGRSADQQVVAHAMPDRIFAGFEERHVAAGQASHNDEIFRGNFLPDRIFSSSRSNDG